jgi:hypothetical protein
VTTLGATVPGWFRTSLFLLALAVLPEIASLESAFLEGRAQRGINSFVRPIENNLLQRILSGGSYTISYWSYVLGTPPVRDAIFRAGFADTTCRNDTLFAFGVNAAERGIFAQDISNLACYGPNENFIGTFQMSNTWYAMRRG